MDKHTQNITTQLIDYREGNLTELQIVEVERQLESSQEWQMIFKELALLDDLMDEVPIMQPTANSKKRFDQLLETEKVVAPIINLNDRSVSYNLNALLKI